MSPARMGADEVAAIVDARGGPDFITLLRAARLSFDRPGFEDDVAARLRAAPRLVQAWDLWCGDQRWTPSAYVNGTEAGWYDGTRHFATQHPDEASATADFIHRLAAWLDDRTVLHADE
ncbi:MAG: hypothetical protein EON52_10975 [Actinomycetales bacterium]|nr:MAG: hypothetical protein EON52_10975 [Actinomycetales bacterium]